jgi:hypothetical protein
VVAQSRERRYNSGMDVTRAEETAATEADAEEAGAAEATDDGAGEEAALGEGLQLPANAAAELREKWGRDNDVSLAELEGLPVAEQFLRIWATPGRGEVLWNFWYRAQPEGSRGFLDMMVENLVTERGLSVEEARTRLAVEKFLSDRGANLAVNYVNTYKARKLRNSRPLKPLQLAKKRKK